MTESVPSKTDDEPGMMLTPMIDVVFQLIVFFMLTLRFKTVDERIQSELPHGVGITTDSRFVEPPSAVRVRLTRAPSLAGPEPATAVELGRAVRVDLPPEGAAREQAFGRLVGVFRDARRALGDVRAGEIATPPPGGAFVPHGDVVAVLDALLEAGVVEVGFEGTMPPVPIPGQGGVIER